MYIFGALYIQFEALMNRYPIAFTIPSQGQVSWIHELWTVFSFKLVPIERKDRK